MNDVVDFININRDRYVDELKQYLAIPSISALPQHAGDVRRCAEWTAEELKRVGMQNVRLIDTPGNPVVYGDWLGAPGAPTILFYGHYDVQPVDPLDQWTTPPFEATVRDGEIYARGSADDKGQVFMHIKAVEAHLKQQGKLPLNIKFFIEGEEEVGSVHLDDFVRSHKSDLSADVVVISDSPMFDRGIPSICYGLRGLAYFQIDLRGSKSDLHSGSFGGAVPNAIAELVELLAGLKDAAGRIAIPGWYDDVVPLTDEERANFAALPFVAEQFKAVTGVGALPGEEGYSPEERMSGRPTADINGIWGGFTGVGSKTIIPAEAHAKVSFRLVADQDPARLEPLFERWVRDSVPEYVQVSVRSFGGVKPALTPLDHPGNRAAAKAVAKAFAKEPLFNREGGSGPERALSDALDAACVYLGVMLPEDRIHAPNERLLLANYYRGVRAAAYALEEFAKPEVATALRGPVA
jgi:acetylornithine deacetylase/succinyl-diaminopimelate desuccinylase-like protein